MLTAEGNARSCNLLLRFGNVVEFPLQYLVVIIKSITYLSFRFLLKYFACFKPLCIGSVYGDGDVEIKVPGSSLVKDTFFFSSSFSFFFFYYYFFYHSYHKNDCLSRKDESFFNNRGQNIITSYDRDINETNKTRHKDK